VAWTFYKTGEVPHHDHSHVDDLDDQVEVGAKA